MPQRAVDQAARALEQGIEKVARRLDEMASLRPGVTAEIARLLAMDDIPQTRRMACAIITNAMGFHDRIAGMHDGVKPLDRVFGPGIANPKADVLAAWTHILTINYWPIFAIAKDLVGQLPIQEAADILRLLQDTAADVAATGVTNAHDLTGRLFQRLIGRPQVPGDLLYPARLRGAVGPARRCQAARRGLVRHSGHRQPESRRLCLRHRRLAVRRLRTDRNPARKPPAATSKPSTR